MRFGRDRRAEAQAFGVGHGFEMAFEAAVAGGVGGEAGEHRAAGEGLRYAAADVQHLTGGQGGAAAGAAEVGLLVEVAFVAQARVEVAAFAEQVFVLVVGVAEHAVGLGVVVGLAVGLGRAMGGRFAAGLVDFAVEVGAGVAGVIGAHADLLFHHLVAGLQGPDGVLAAAAQAGGRAHRQGDVELVAALVVAELDDVDAQALVAGAAVPDADVGQQAGDEVQVAFVVLHHLFAARVLAVQAEEEVLAEKTVAAAQDALDDFRHRLLQVEARLPATGEPAQAWLQGDFVARFVDRTGQALAGADHAVKRAQRFDRFGYFPGHHGQGRWRGVQAELGVLAEQPVGAEVEVAGGEFDGVGEGLAEVFFAFEGEDVEGGVEAVDVQFVAAVVEEGAQCGAHGQAFLV
ncbi:hypothetical protein D3C76_943780 [compost metagenome]